MRSMIPMSLDEQVTISMASMPERMTGMLSTVETLLPRCDNFDLCLNGYPSGFNAEILDDPRVTVIHTRPDEQVGARGKFYLNSRTPGYHLTVDDDIEYPDDYVFTMVRAIESYRREAIVGMHGQLLTYPSGRKLLHFDRAYDQDWPVHILGTGVMGYHASVLPICWDSLLPGKIDDQVAWYAQQYQIPMIVMAHQANWICDREDLCLINSLRRNLPLRKEADNRVRSRTWQLYYPSI